MLVIFSLATPILVFETFLEYRYIQQKKDFNQGATNIINDEKNNLSFIKNLLLKYDNAQPNILPILFRETNGLNAENGRIYPLGGISNTTSHLGNENGYFPIIQLDKYGFNNPDNSVYDKVADIMLVGDSFTEGESVEVEDSIAGNLRKANYSTINFGKGGNGPLIELANLVEYGKKLKPKKVFWIYYEDNDLSDLVVELTNPILKKYLKDDTFSQNLINRQSEIDIILKDYASKEFAKIDKRNHEIDFKKKK